MDASSLFNLGLGATGLGTAFKFGTGLLQNAMANKIKPVFDDQYVKAQLGTAQNMFNGRMAGAANLENNIRAAQGQTMNNINRNATDASQALALAQGTQNTANDQFNNLQTQEAQNKYAMLQNLNNAYGAANQNMLNKFQIETQAKSATREGAYKNMFGALGDLGALGISAGSLGLFGRANKTTQSPHVFTW